MSIFFITGNQNKFNEVKSIIPDVEQIDIDLPEIQHIDPREIIKAKLHEAFNHKQGEFIVEDTSLYFDFMNGLPGPLIKWFMKTMGNEQLYAMVRQSGNFKATAQTMIGYAESPEDIHFFEGKISGKIISPKGTKGFGWDPIFEPNGYAKSFAELSSEEKNSISMRRIAILKFKKYFEETI